MKTWRLLDTPPMSAADNMAMDQTLLELKGSGKSPDTIRFLQFKPRSVLVGYHQAIQEEIRMGYCRENNIDVNRRITGGGAIFFDENQLGWEIYCDKRFFDIVIPNNRLFRSLCQPVARALGQLGLDAVFRPRNDIEINGRKISGTGGTESGDAFMFQGTMLVDFDVDTMLRALHIPVEKLKAKEIDSVKDRVTCLNWELGYTPSLDDIKSAIRYGFETDLGIELVPGSLTDEEQALFEKKQAYFHSMEWIDKVKPRYQRREAVQSSYKADAGMVRFTLVVNLSSRRLKDIYITGDFLSFPGRALYDLETRLRGMKLDKDELLGVINREFEQGRITIPGMTADEFTQPLLQALEKVKITDFGIDLEHANMISVANGSFEEIMKKDPSVLLLPYCAKQTECDLRYKKGCTTCGLNECTIGTAWQMGRGKKMKVLTVVNYEDLWEEIMKMKAKGTQAYIGCCCTPFYAKHADAFRRAELPGILLDIDNTTCYDLDQAKEAYSGTFESQTELDLDLLETVLAAGERINKKDVE
ncbi:MAG: lipoate--protein ligase family protein [Desulfobacterales bacterium]|nr:lipoate--protein ligase family protein [Desulfobacterales bacterium]